MTIGGEFVHPRASVVKKKTPRSPWFALQAAARFDLGGIEVGKRARLAGTLMVIGVEAVKTRSRRSAFSKLLLDSPEGRMLHHPWSHCHIVMILR
jgi:hypothetical protein